MYIFNNIELLIALGDTGVLDNTDSEIYVTDMSLEAPCFEYYTKNKLKKLVENNVIKTYSLADEFYKFALKQQINFPGIDLMAFAAIYFAKENGGFLISSNPTIKQCAKINGVSVPEIKDTLLTILKEEKYVELFIKI